MLFLDDFCMWVEVCVDEEGVDLEMVFVWVFGIYWFVVSDVGELFDGDVMVFECFDGVEGCVEVFEGELDEKIFDVWMCVV